MESQLHFNFWEVRNQKLTKSKEKTKEKKAST
jgi:hypothetical protein